MQFSRRMNPFSNLSSSIFCIFHFQLGKPTSVLFPKRNCWLLSPFSLEDLEDSEGNVTGVTAEMADDDDDDKADDAAPAPAPTEEWSPSQPAFKITIVLLDGAG